MAALTCTRVDARGRVCGGEIDEGVCSTCGRPAESGALAGAVATAAAATASPNLAAQPGPWGAAAAPAAQAESPLAAGGWSGATVSRTTGTAARTGPLGHTVGHTKGSRASRRQSRGTTSRRQSLGGGLVSLPPQPSQDPLSLVIARPEVSLGKRRCPHCDARVNRVKGFCPQCSEAYDFEPKLKPGDVVAGKYEVKGAIAFGGMGWVYLGWDAVLSRWVVLKGLLNSKDPEAVAAALAERQFLAAVKHARIVGIYDFVSQGPEGFMVLEYVGGRTVEAIREERGPLPPEEAIAYILGILPAFGALHAQGFVYCDFKPGNLMVESDDVKLIDMGAVRRIGDPDGAVFGTDGYSAKEASDEPTPVSDLYTVGRTLAVLLMDFLYRVQKDTDPATGAVTATRRMRADYVHALPTPDVAPILAANDPLYRFLIRATHDDPDQRFQTAEEMEGQLFGVLRETVALKSGPRPAESRVFFGDGLADGSDRAGAAAPLARLLPALRLDTGDPGAADVLSLAAVLDPARRIDGLRALVRKRPNSAEAKLRLAEALIAVGRGDRAVAELGDALKANEFEWRAYWYAGLVHLGAGHADRAYTAFDRVYFEMPGELAPKLAMAFAAEAGGRDAQAAALYRRVVATDPSYASACFGLARCEGRAGRFDDAAAALSAVPATHSLSVAARTELVSLLIGMGTAVDEARLARAAGVIEGIKADTAEMHLLTARLFAAALKPVAEGTVAERRDVTLLGRPMTANALRRGAEAAYLQAGRRAASRSEKARLVDLAHAVRPVTLL
ncbi:serine/threonine-protein kinase [Lichenibacterium dinghuense]|uniref:serine/threonine-protein kinase n=1 Tax=Lichenibacterium dinghuense TaxID=2895977 RepID=UPI001F191B88|nr:serine/threonine-protein kinase [Lichenibacterium sp. 6Y81]